ncbi:probable 28S ribosomal protein S6, mitochondrial [Homarus americanus]|nr:probable 28S ribosomal protein S6, mitochondrial [Homarus americanus]
MSLYELSLIVRNMPKAGLVTAVKRVSESILDEGGYVSKIESLGARELPYKMTAHGQVHTKGNYFLIHFAAPPTSLSDITDNCRRDIDLVRPLVSRIESKARFECTLHEEVQPPSSRPEVHKMIREAEKRLPPHIKKKFRLNTDLGYNPF